MIEHEQANHGERGGRRKRRVDGALAANLALEAAGLWWAAVPKSEWPDDPDFLREIQSVSEGEYGDRRQELVIIGADMDHAAVHAALDRCLLTDDEMALGWKGWRKFSDPFDSWD